MVLNNISIALNETLLGEYSFEKDYVNLSNEGVEENFIGTKDLNIKNSYADIKPLSISEHIQNWRDRCVEIALTLDKNFMNNSFLPKVSTFSNNWTTYEFFYQEKLLGWVAIKELANNKLHFEFFNASTSLESEKVLVMGYSSKRSSQLAGFFGEGVKVEINALTNKGGKVVYYTNNTCWEFFYNNREILHASVSSVELHIPNSTHIILSDIPKSAFIPEDYLFFKPCMTKYYSNYERNKKNLSGMEILLDDHTKNRIYVHGIYICRFQDSPFPFGLNYYGDCNMKDLEIGRDRNSVSIPTFIKLLFDVFLHYRKHEKEFGELMELFYNSFSFSTSHKYYFSSQSCSYNRSNDLPIISEGLVAYYLSKFNKNTIPFESKPTPDQHRDLQFYHKGHVVVTRELFQWLSLSPNCPSIDNIELEKSISLLKAPEYKLDETPPLYDDIEFLQSELIEHYRYFKTIICDYFKDPLIQNSIFFKKLPFSDINLTSYIKVPLPNRIQKAFIINTAGLKVDQIHKQLKNEDKDFKCLGNCCCIANILVEDILYQLPNDMKKKYDRRFRNRHFIGTFPNNLPPLPVDENQSENKSSNNNGSPEEKDSIIDPLVKDEKQSIIVQAKPKTENKQEKLITNTNTRAKNNSSQESFGESIEPNPTQTIVSETSQENKNNQETLQNLAENLHSCVEKCCNIPKQMKENELSDTFFCQECSEPSKPPTVEDTCSLVSTESYRKYSKSSLLGMNIYSPDTISETELSNFLTSNEKQFLLMDQIIYFLTTKIFSYDTKKVHLLYHPTTSTIAFNRNYHIFFNIVAMIPIYSKEIANVSHFWFICYCHELTHNVIRCHNSTFATYSEYLIIQMMGKFNLYLPKESFMMNYLQIRDNKPPIIQSKTENNKLKNIKNYKIHSFESPKINNSDQKKKSAEFLHYPNIPDLQKETDSTVNLLSTDFGDSSEPSFFNCNISLEDIVNSNLDLEIPSVYLNSKEYQKSSVIDKNIEFHSSEGNLQDKCIDYRIQIKNEQINLKLEKGKFIIYISSISSSEENSQPNSKAQIIQRVNQRRQMIRNSGDNLDNTNNQVLEMNHSDNKSSAKRTDSSNIRAQFMQRVNQRRQKIRNSRDDLI